MDSFCAQIAEGEFGADETPESLGLYGGRLTIVFYPGEMWRTVWVHSCACSLADLTLVLFPFFPRDRLHEA
jgi:hypothetical protein